MSDPPWDRVQDIFNAALESDDRNAYVLRTCGDDTSLRDAVERLLAAHDDTGLLPSLD